MTKVLGLKGLELGTVNICTMGELQQHEFEKYDLTNLAAKYSVFHCYIPFPKLGSN
jgi:hypothetical protein